jgi:hypothetical protein
MGGYNGVEIWYITYLEFGGAVMLDLHFKQTFILCPLALVIWSTSKALAIPYGVQPGFGLHAFV